MKFGGKHVNCAAWAPIMILTKTNDFKDVDSLWRELDNGESVCAKSYGALATAKLEPAFRVSKLRNRAPLT